MAAMWAWTAPEKVERAAGEVTFRGWRRYHPVAIPALWMRIADLRMALDEREQDSGWWTALQAYGPLFPDYDERGHEEGRHRDPWRRAIARLADISSLWRKGEFAVWELPTAPIDLSRAHHRLQGELMRVAFDEVRLAVRDLELVPEPVTLDAFLWLSAAESVRDRHRFKRCSRCDGWFQIQRADALFCSSRCRNKRETGGPEAAPALD